MKKIGDPNFEFQDVKDRIDALIERYKEHSTLSGKYLFRARPSPPAEIFKYTNAANSHLILGNLSLRYTQSEVLDDVFEEAPHRDELRRLMPTYEDGPTLVIDIGDPEERLEAFDRVRNARAAMRKADVALSDDVPIITCNGIVPGWQYELGNRPLKYVLEGSRKPLALSLTELSNDVKMWSAYADSHRGIRLGFNSRSKYFRSNRDLIARPGYFAPIEYRPISVEDYAYRYPHERFFIKTPDWAGQREWRRIEFTPESPNADWKKDVFTFPFPPEALKSIAFGARCSAEDVEMIANQVHSDPRLAHLRLERARLSVGQLHIESL